MDERLLQIRDHQGEGFQPLVYFGSWRVAILRPRADTRAEGITVMERHTQTDEVFVLTRGRGVLLIGGDGPQLDGVHETTMEPGKIYNVRCNVWHAVLLGRDASVLIVENQDTGTSNSEYVPLTAPQRSLIFGIEKREEPE
jgi:ureidoglycolate hydrolase